MTLNLTDEALMVAVREGARSELGVLFERHHRSIYEFFFRMSGDRAVSENLVQDVFDRIVKFRDTYRDDGYFRAWLYRIARSAHHAHCMRKDTAVSQDNKTSHALMPDSSDQSAMMRYALHGLPEDRRELIVLTQYLHLPPEEIAELLGVDVPDAKFRVRRALFELRALYGKKSPEKRHAI